MVVNGAFFKVQKHIAAFSWSTYINYSIQKAGGGGDVKL